MIESLIVMAGLVALTLLFMWFISSEAPPVMQDCRHNFDKWDNPHKNDRDSPNYTQTRVCRKCNLVEVRIVK